MATLRLRTLLLLALAAPVVPAEAKPNAEGPLPIRHVFVTSTTGSGDLETWLEVNGTGLKGLEAGDAICQARAESAGLTTNGSDAFIAWMSDANDDLFCRVRGLTGTKGDIVGSCGGAKLPGAGPWARVDELLWGEEIDTLTDPEPSGGPRVQIDLDENGDLLLDQSYMTATNEFGIYPATGADCGGWDSDAGTWDGSLTNAVDGWSGGANSGCGGGLRLLCVEKGAGAQPPKALAAGALVFVTSTSCAGDLGACTAESDSGVTAADNLCRARAAAGHLPSPQSFLAWISVNGAGAGTRLGTGPWKRVDGYPVASNAADWKDGHIGAALFVDELGGEANAGSASWTGTSINGNPTAANCVGWTSPLMADKGTIGWPPRTGEYWTANSDTAGCNIPRRLYCFSNDVVIFWNDFEPGGFDPDWSQSQGLLP